MVKLEPTPRPQERTITRMKTSSSRLKAENAQTITPKNILQNYLETNPPRDWQTWADSQTDRIGAIQKMAEAFTAHSKYLDSYFNPKIEEINKL